VLLVRRVRAAAERTEVGESQPGERPKVAVTLQPDEALVLALVCRALARECLAEVGMAEAHGFADKASPAAEGAEFFFLL
jgi:hypothetical protein